MLAGDIDAFPRFANNQALDQFKNDSRFQVLVGGTEGKTILAIVPSFAERYISTVLFEGI